MDFSHIDQISAYTEINTLCDLMEYYGKQIEMEQYYLDMYKQDIYVQEEVEVPNNPNQPQTQNQSQNQSQPQTQSQQPQPQTDKINQSQNKIAQLASKVWEWLRQAVHKMSKWFKNVWDNIINKKQKAEINKAIEDRKNIDPNLLNEVAKAAQDVINENHQESFYINDEGSYYQEALGPLAIKLGLAAGKNIGHLLLDFITAGAFTYVGAGSSAVDKNTVRNSVPIKTYRNIKYEANNAVNIANAGVALSGSSPVFVDDLKAIFKFDPVTNTVGAGTITVPKSLQVLFNTTNLASTTIVAIIVDWAIQTNIEFKDGRNANNTVIDAAFETAVNNMQRVVEKIIQNSTSTTELLSKLESAANEKDVEKQMKSLEYIDKYFRGQGLLDLVNEVEWTTGVQSRHLSMLHKAMNAIDANINDRNSLLGKLCMGIMDKTGQNSLPNNEKSTTWNDTLATSVGFSDKSTIVKEHAWLTKVFVPIIRHTSTLFTIIQGLTQCNHDFWCFAQEVLNIGAEYHHANIDMAAQYRTKFLENKYAKQQGEIAKDKIRDAAQTYYNNSPVSQVASNVKSKLDSLDVSNVFPPPSNPAGSVPFMA